MVPSLILDVPLLKRIWNAASQNFRLLARWPDCLRLGSNFSDVPFSYCGYLGNLRNLNKIKIGSLATNYKVNSALPAVKKIRGKMFSPD